MLAVMMSGAMILGGTSAVFASDSEEIRSFSVDNMVEMEDCDWYVLTDNFGAYLPNEWVDMTEDAEEEGTEAMIGYEDGSCYIQVITSANPDLDVDGVLEQMESTGSYDMVMKCVINDMEGVYGAAATDSSQAACFAVISEDAESITQFVVIESDKNDTNDQICANFLYSLIPLSESEADSAVESVAEDVQ